MTVTTGTGAGARQVHLRTCPLCEAMCGLEIHVADDRVELIRADRDDAWSRGHLCPKGTAVGHLHHDPDRLRRPLVREGDTWREVGWDAAFRRCDELLAPVIAEHGIEAVTAYVGNPLAHNFSLGRYVGILIGMSGIPMIYSAGTVDLWPKNVSSHLMYGGMWKIPVPDIGRTDLLVVMGANPHASQGSLLACPDVALGGLDCMISVDNYLNETTRRAHVILPGLSPLEQAHHDDLLWLFAVGSAARYSPPVFPPADGRPHEWEILIRLAGACLGMPADEVAVAAIDDGFFDVMASTQGLDGPALRAGYDAGGPERLLDLTLRAGPFGDRYGEVPGGLTLDRVKAEPHGIHLGPMVPRLDQVVTIPGGRVVLAPPYITADVPRLAARLDRPADDLVLVNRRHLRSNNSWMHNVPVLVKGRNRCTLHIHPDDARRCGVADGEVAAVASSAGRVEVPVEVTDAVTPGVVSLPHGWGHDRPGARLSVAREHAGINSNVLSPGDFVDVISGNAAVNGIPVTVEPAGVTAP